MLAHEIAHIASVMPQTSSRRMRCEVGPGLAGALLGNTGGAAARRRGGLLTGGVFLKFNRDEEREADRVGMTILMRRAGGTGGMVELFEML